ncbi:MAG: 2-hydroxyacyl-CoA dehydratase family protein [Thermodesulfobacteriota bacterium]|nr:2-hydroxyacyl-CoA dehydratase family protein [Thermodesulfobacteriota bacterium]
MELKTLKKIDQLLEDRKEKIKQARVKGTKVVGYLCCRVPVEIIHAHGMIPIRVGNASPSYMDSGKEYIHQFTCPYVKSVVGEFMTEGSFYYENVDLVAGSVICLTVSRTLEVIKVYTGKPTLPIHIPQLPPGNGEVRFFTEEVKWLSQQLENITGTKLANERLSQSVKLYDDIRADMKKLYKMQSEKGSPLTWPQLFRLIQASFLLDPECYRSLLEEVITEMSTLGIQETSDNCLRIMLSGSPILPMDNLIIDTIEGAGGRIVADNLCTGIRTFDGLRVAEPTIEGIASAYIYDCPCSSAQDPNLEKDRRLDHMLGLISEHEVDGVVYYCLRFCDPFAFKDDETKAVLAKRTGTPLLPIHWEYGDSYGSLWTRVEGFMESMKAMRK